MEGEGGGGDTHDEERVVGGLEDAVLGHGVGHFVLGDDHLLLEDLDGVQVAGALLSAQDHFAERSFAQHLDELKVLQRLRTRKPTRFNPTTSTTPTTFSTSSETQ